MTIISTTTLMKIASIGGIATVSMGLLTRWKITDNLKNCETFKEVINTVKSNSEAVRVLGEPINVLNVNIDNNTKNYVENNHAYFEVPLKGSLKKGILYFWAEKINEKWIVPKIELELEDDKKNRLKIK